MIVYIFSQTILIWASESPKIYKNRSFTGIKYDSSVILVKENKSDHQNHEINYLSDISVYLITPLNNPNLINIRYQNNVHNYDHLDQ